MMLPQDPLRQRMLMKTERKAVGAGGGTPTQIATEMNEAFSRLAGENYDVAQIFAAEGGFVVIGHRVSSPVADPTPLGVPIPGTSAVQDIEVIYTYIAEGKPQTMKAKTLQEAVRHAVNDLEGKSSPSAQPLKIEVVSRTIYTTGDLHVLRNMT